jgi:hypothetical protein
MIAVIIAVVVIAISALMEYLFSFFEILFKRPLSPKGAVEIDPVEHIYAHPDYTGQLQDPDSFDVKTVYEALRRGQGIDPGRPQFSYRSASDQPFKSYTYKFVSFSPSLFHLSLSLATDKYSRSREKSAVVSSTPAFRPRTRPSSAFIVQPQ